MLKIIKDLQVALTQDYRDARLWAELGKANSAMADLPSKQNAAAERQKLIERAAFCHTKAIKYAHMSGQMTGMASI